MKALTIANKDILDQRPEAFVKCLPKWEAIIHPQYYVYVGCRLQ